MGSKCSKNAHIGDIFFEFPLEHVLGLNSSCTETVVGRSGTLHCCQAAHVGKVELVSVMVLANYQLTINVHFTGHHSKQ